MINRPLRTCLAVITGAALLAGCDSGSPSETTAATKTDALEMFSWWTAGGEAEGLKAMYTVYDTKNPGVTVTNAAVAGSGGANARAALAQRLQGGDPPDAFQVHIGAEILTYPPEQYVQSLDDLFAEHGWLDHFPAALKDLLKFDGHYYSVPVNVHRANVMFYNKKIFTDNGLQAPATLDEFFTVADTLKAKGITPFAFGNQGGWEDELLLESVLIAGLGAADYSALWSGSLAWTDPKVATALEAYNKMISYANSDHSAMSFDGAAQLIVDGKAAMFIHGDWTDGYFTSKNFTGYGFAAAPGNKGVFDVVSDAFALPKDAKNQVNAEAWLDLAASKEGQEAFNPKKGSICARTDCDQSLFNPYLQQSAKDFAADTLVLSSASAAAPAYATAANTATALLSANGDIGAFQKAMQQACEDAGVCK
ncbi:ABC transporter substrate-binding protein [Actinoplanes sp. NPDC051861]|uniref:ABC transporter substrate-binding protein n=1 Tax=Actinoplanes sp. NPDC051861 TaxID=3155170 RepID=UPI00344218BE